VTERVQLGVRMEKRLVKVLKGPAEFEDLTLSQIVPHSFEPAAGHVGELAASPRALATIEELKRVYDVHGFRDFGEPE
jgi:hypothetical protein